jgi:hypothetical protein
MFQLRAACLLRRLSRLGMTLPVDDERVSALAAVAGKWLSARLAVAPEKLTLSTKQSDSLVVNGIAV